MKRKFLSVVMVSCLTLALCACSGKGGGGLSSNGSNDTKDAKQYKLSVLRPIAYSKVEGLSLEPGSFISMIGRNSNDSYWEEVEAGAKQAVADLNTMLGYKGSDKIKLSYAAPEVCDDVNEQVSILDEELSRYPAAIAIATIDASACSIQFDLAAEDSIPIVTFDSGNDYQHIAAHVSTDNIDAAQTAAAKLANAIEEKGEVAVFVQDSVSTTAKNRLQGFLDKLTADYPDVSVVNIYHMDQLDEVSKTIAEAKQVEADTLTQEDVVNYVLESHPDLKGIYTTNLDTTQLVADVISDLERDDLKFVGFDGGKEQMKLVEDGLLEGVIVQNPYGMGYAAIVAAVRTSLGLANESFVNTGYTWVTKDNMKKEEIKYMLY